MLQQHRPGPSAGHCSAVLPALLLCCAELRGAAALEDQLELNGTLNVTNGTQPILSAEAIANITATVVGVCLISSMLCYLLLVFNKQERMQRVKSALERNR